MRAEARGTPVVDFSCISSTERRAHDSKSGLRLSTGQLVGRYASFAILALGGVALDLWSKFYVFGELSYPGRRRIWSGKVLGVAVQFDFSTTFNHGALWGIGQNQTWLFASLSFVAIAVIFYCLMTKQAVASWWLTIVSGLLLAGTLGNLYDRLGLHGWKDDRGPVYAVRDFLDFVFCDGAFNWATFNFADVFLVTGAIVLCVHSFLISNDGASTKSELPILAGNLDSSNQPLQ